MYFAGTQRPSHVVRALLGLRHLGGHLLDVGFYHGGVWTTIPNRTHLSPYTVKRNTLRPLSTLGESCGIIGIPRVGRCRGLQDTAVSLVGGTGLFANIPGWIERHLRIK